MNDDDLSPDEAAAAEAARRKASAQSAAADLARMGIDPRALGLQSGQPSRRPEVARPAAPPEQPRGEESPNPANVVPLRPSRHSAPALPASGTSAAWSPTPPPLAPDQAPTGSQPGPLENLLGQGPAPEAPRHSMNHLARAITYGMLTPDAADSAERERDMVNRVRTRQTDQRVVVFLAGKGGVGTTSVAVGVGSVLAALRDDSTTLVSLRPGTPSLGFALAGAKAPTARDIARRDVEIAPLRLQNGLQVVDGPRWGTPVRRADIPPILDRLGQTGTFALFDVGNDASESGHSILSRADQIVIVSGAGSDGIAGARVAAERAAEIDPYLLDSAIYVVVCQHEGSLKSVVKAMRSTMAGGAARVVAVPPEPRLADGAAFDPATVRVASRLAMIDIAGMVALGSLTHRATR